MAHTVVKRGLVLEQPYYISPLYIYFLASIYKFFGSAINTVRFIQFSLGVGTSLLTFALARRLFDNKVGIVAGFLAAIYIPFLFFEGNLLGTSVATFCLISSLVCLVNTRPKWSGYPLAFASGILLALAITGRPNLLLLVPIPILFIILNKGKYGKKSAAFIFLIILGGTVPIGLTGVHNYLSGNQFTILTTHGGINFFIGNNPNASGTWEPPEGIEANVSAINLTESKRFAEEATNKVLTASQVSRFWYNRAFGFILSHPIQWGGLLAKKFLLFWSSYEPPVNLDYYFHQQYTSLLRFPLFNLTFYMPFTILGLVLLAPKWRNYWVLYTTIAVVCLSTVMFYMGHRYRIVVMPLMIIMTAIGIVKLLDLIRNKSSKRWLVLGSLVVLFMVQIGYTQRRISHTNYANDYYNLSLAHLINENPGSAIYWGQLAVAEDPMYSNAHYNLGVAYLKQKQHAEALSAFSAVIQIDPTEAGAQRNIGGLLLMRHEYRAALPYLAEAFEYEPENIITLMNLGLAHYYLGEYVKAIDMWQLVLNVDPQHEQARNNIRAAKRFF